jgi:hypothetical protein
MFGKQLSLVLVAAGMMLTTGCQQNNMVDHVVFKPSDDLKIIRVSLVFKDTVQSNMDGLVNTEYGQFFMTPYSTTQPFEIGFDLNMNIFYDQHYVGLQPTMTLPNGLPIGIPYPVVEVKDPKPISDKFDIYGYVDVGHLSWLGVSTMFYFMNDQYFPADLAVSSVFLRDATGNPGIIAHVFGPSLSPEGILLRNGGIGVFANVRQLIAQYSGKSGEMKLYPEKKPIITGRNADKVTSKMLKKLQHRMIQGFNGML